MPFGERILDYWDDIEKDLAALVAIPSVCSAPEGGFPYGKEAARALDTVLAMAERYGLETKNVGYRAGHAQYGEGEENAAVMAHIDVVPAGEGWNTDPFTFTKSGNIAYGRGVADNKGAAVVALHCLRAIKDAGVPARRKLRVIFGSGEEIGMEDMRCYFATEQAPDMGFTPDAAYGICNCEKGIMNVAISTKNNSGVIRTFKAGTVPNAVPYKAQCELSCTAEEYAVLSEAAEKCAGDFSLERMADGARILSVGKASHASVPQDGLNAASHLIKLLESVFGAEKLGSFFAFIAGKIGLSTDGSLMGIAQSDEPSGNLTLNLGIVSADAENASLIIDIRYPATKDGDGIARAIEAEAAKYGLEFKLKSMQKPLYLPAESPLISLLSASYEEMTGEKCSLFSMGGGTYARTMGGKGVAFGPVFPGQAPSNEHNCNECIDIEMFRLHAKICLEAMYKMITA